MNRIKLIQQVFQQEKHQNYLEIGCQTGTSFLPIKAKNKIAVDPLFKIPPIKKLMWLMIEPNNRRNKYYEEESDVFFQKRKNRLKKLGQLDVVLIDGLHSFVNSLRDVLNSLQYLNKGGLIVMHDCLPPHTAAALPTGIFPSIKKQRRVKGWTGEWCGDVWKTIVYLRECFAKSLNVCVINTDYGLGIVRLKSEIESKNLDFTIDEALFAKIDKLTYSEMIQEADTVLNLKPVGYINAILDEMKHES